MQHVTMPVHTCPPSRHTSLAPHGPTEKHDLEKLTDQEFLAAYAWAVYVSAFKARIVNTKWAALSKAWRDFDPQLRNGQSREEALKVIGHEKKANAILSVARLIAKVTWPKFKSQYCRNADSLATLPRMGPRIAVLSPGT